LHVSAGGLQVPHEQVEEQVRIPEDPQLVVHPSVEPRQHPRPLSHSSSQSSSMPLQVSEGGVQSPGPGSVQVSLQRPVPELPQLVVQVRLDPMTQGKLSSAEPLQLSSSPLQISAPAAQPLPVGISHAEVHTPSPVVPQSVTQATSVPRAQAKPLSASPSQSSSTPLQVSSGGLQSEGSG